MAKQTRSSRSWQKPFLQTLAETSNVTASADSAGIAAHKAYNHKKKNAKFAAQWLEALLEGYQRLEMEVLCYLRDPEPKRKMDVGAALRALAAHRETTARERAFREDEDEQAVLESIDNFLKDMRQKRRANADILQAGKAKDEADRLS